MPDMEKVIRGLAQVSEYTRTKADIAGVGKGKEIFDSWFRVVEDAIDLLMEQEPVPPWSRIDISPEGTAMVINCGACHTELARVQRGVPFYDVQENVKYCIRCGKAVKWE